ncbi:MAG: hypothetical protein M1324_02550 [Patescibacteria group bacterium]|nr:hypothetical protein [Patescibacteria group bacterium]
MSEKNFKNYKDLITKVDDAKKKNPLDLSADQDLSIAIMNLISIEEHFFFTQQKTGKSEYLDLLKEVREMRKDLLKKIIKDSEGEVWCISKHLLAASMRLEEVGTKMLGQDKKKEAEDLFKKAFDLYSLFWGVNMNIVDTKNIQKIDEKALDKKDTEKSGFMGKLSGLVKKAIDCCIE